MALKIGARKGQTPPPDGGAELLYLQVSELVGALDIGDQMALVSAFQNSEEWDQLSTEVQAVFYKLDRWCRRAR